MAPQPPYQPRPAEVVRELESEIAAIHLKSYGEDIRRIQVSVLDDTVIVVLDISLLTHERLVNAAGGGNSVRQIRKSYQKAIGATFIAAVEHATGRRVVGLVSDTHLDPAFSVEVFRLGPRQPTEVPGHGQ